MRKVFTFSAIVAITATMLAQSPEEISYQAVVRGADNALIANQVVGMQISILQGTVTGTAVYIETHTPRTNANGLISLEIGTGTIINGDFSSIDWANGPYFLKTETDPEGGTNYTLTGNSQLLSVPYALHAKTADALTDGIIETDPVYSASQAMNITANDISNLNNLSGINTGDQDLSGLAVKTALNDSIAKVRSEIPDVTGFLTTEKQTLSDVVKMGNLANAQLKNVTNPTDAQDAATKAYVDALVAQILELQLVTGVKIKDIDGNIYGTVTINDQVWMTENLKTTRYDDGKVIPLVTDNAEWSSLTTPGYCWYRDDKSTYSSVYGALYNWYTIGTGNVCPVGWHVPSDKDWMTLTTYLSGEKVSGGKLKEAGTIHWNKPNTKATNETGFTALPGGIRNNLGSYNYMGYQGYWWSSSPLGSSAWPRYMNYDSGSVDKFPTDMKNGMSVRCLKD